MAARFEQAPPLHNTVIEQKCQEYRHILLFENILRKQICHVPKDLLEADQTKLE